MQPSILHPLAIGSTTSANRVFLAPMSGVSDLPFRRLAHQFGAGLVISEMVASQELVVANPDSRVRMDVSGLTTPVVQLAGREAQWMAQAARIAQEAGAQIIDINMGCPAKKVTSGYSGSALMRDLDHALSLIEATVQAVDVPVTLKMRLGWDSHTINAPRLAARAEMAGVQMVTVHGRTRSQFYTGQADWRAILAVKDAVSIPVVANGDVTSLDDLHAIRHASGCDAVMVGRATYGRPWLPGYLASDDPARYFEALPDPVDFILDHYQALITHHPIHKDQPMGVRIARKHLGWYLATTISDDPLDERARRILYQSDDPWAVEEAIRTVWAGAAWRVPVGRECVLDQAGALAA